MPACCKTRALCAYLAVMGDLGCRCLQVDEARTIQLAIVEQPLL